MLKPFRGQAELIVGDKSYLLYLDINRLIDLEKLLGHPLPRLMEMIDQTYVHIIRGVLWMAALKHQPDTTEDEMGEAMVMAGEENMSAALGTLFSEVMPVSAKEAGGSGENPQKPGETPAGTGTGSPKSGANRASRRATSATRRREASPSPSPATAPSAGGKATSR